MPLRGERPMKPGPPKKPAELKLLQGNPGERRLPKREIEIPEPNATPPLLTGRGREEWDRLAPLLKTLGLLKTIDREVLICYCQAVHDYDWAVRTLRKDGKIVRAGNGTKIPHPALAIQKRAASEILKFSVQFGMTPAARAGIDLEKGKGGDPGDPKARFFNRSRDTKPSA